MLNLALKGLESAINKTLSLDPETLERLASLEGKVIAVNVTDWRITLYFVPGVQGITLTTQLDREPDTTLSGTLVSLFNVGCAKGRSDALFKHKINFYGDIAVGESIRSILANIDIDWEEQLSHLVGDVAAHGVGEGARQIFRFGKRFSAVMSDNLKIFLQQEVALTPSRQDVEFFVKEVQTLQYDVDRAEARLNRLIDRRGVKS